MEDQRFRQNALQKLDSIYTIKKSMDLWLVLWAEKECPVQVGDKYPVWVHPDIMHNMVVSKVSAKLIIDRKFVWWVEGWVEFPDSRELHSDTFEMEENDET